MFGYLIIIEDLAGVFGYLIIFEDWKVCFQSKIGHFLDKNEQKIKNMHLFKYE